MMPSQTSIESYRELKESGQLGDEQEYVYRQLKEHGPCTGRDLYIHLWDAHGITSDPRDHVTTGDGQASFEVMS